MPKVTQIKQTPALFWRFLCILWLLTPSSPIYGINDNTWPEKPIFTHKNFRYVSIWSKNIISLFSGGHLGFWVHFEFGLFDMKSNNTIGFLDLKNPYLHQKSAGLHHLRAEIWQFNFLVAILDFRGHFEFGPYDMKNDNIIKFPELKNPYFLQKSADLCSLGQRYDYSILRWPSWILGAILNFDPWILKQYHILKHWPLKPTKMSK